MAAEIQAEIEAIQDAIKAEMAARGVDTLAGADWKAQGLGCAPFLAHIWRTP